MGYSNIICLVCIVHCFDIVSAITGRTLQSDPHACILEEIEEYKKPMYICCDGYYKENSTVIESPCIECQDGYYGKDCAYHCLCRNGGICNKIYGSCQCLPSHYGTHCDFPCPCDNGGTCNVEFGVLKSCTCKVGYYGDICENQCSCPDGITCDPITGCLCKAGTYGEDCSGICQCPSNSVCNIADGSCTCHPGFYGDKCQHQCDCFNGGRCGRKDPNICECPTSWQGSKCTKCNIRLYVDTDINETYCADKCLHCYNGDDCTPHNKTCECTPGWLGDRCDLPCETGYHGYNCSQICECDYVDGCDHVTGHCIVTNDEEQLCPDRCLECHQATDECKNCCENCTIGSCVQNKVHKTESGVRHTVIVVLLSMTAFVFVVVFIASLLCSHNQETKADSLNKQEDPDYATIDYIQMRQINNISIVTYKANNNQQLRDFATDEAKCLKTDKTTG